MNKFYTKCLVWFTSVFLCVQIKAEVFTAIAEVENLLDTHKRIIDDLDIYVGEEINKISKLKRHLNLFKREHESAVRNVSNYLENPINAFTLIKRLTTDVSHIDETIKVGKDLGNIFTVNRTDVKYPTLEDLSGAAQGLIRLQKTYKLDIEDLADGILKGISYSSPMSAGDCYELGRILYKEEDYENAGAWLMEALLKYQDEKFPYPFNEVDILQHMGLSYNFLGDSENLPDWTQLLEPKQSKEEGEVQPAQQLKNKAQEKIKKKVEDKPGKSTKAYGTNVEEALCRGEINIPTNISNKLTCRYLTENDPFLRIAPIKVEYIYLDPDVILFHDVISDAEIEEIKKLAKPRFKRAMVNDGNGTYVPSQIRISKSAFLNDKESPTIARLSRRTTHMTGLSMETAEALQVANYGIGGFYKGHHDFTTGKTAANANPSIGNRIATVLFYMSEVPQGGATVFLDLGLSVFPVHRGAIFWMNLHPNGQVNYDTTHAACPVLIGSKWASNKWIHEGGQEFRRPCLPEHREAPRRKSSK